MSQTILLIEDDVALAEGLLYAFGEAGYETMHATTQREALECIDAGGFDIAIIDISLPDGSGYTVCAHLRQNSDLPVIFLTSFDDEANIVMGLETGADDYVTKPFRLKELISRIRAQLRRSSQSHSQQMQFGDIAIDAAQAKALIHDTPLQLTVTELRLLSILVQHAGQTMTRAALLDKLWDNRGDFVDDNTLSVHILHLREKLLAAGSKVQIVTARGIGYRLEG
ncbi:response regulator transcription factor [Eubacteriales bacterium OttesenSCG-928-N14]|nr:response regulator transcription factor [Eubacteriales bacterium OttesenSCG-928-N14]